MDEGAQWGASPPPLTGGADSPPPARSAEAQGCYERALAELEAGRVMGATALLRRALALSPGDAEVQGALTRLLERRR
jgi:Flp pilus assembly protein TadD